MRTADVMLNHERPRPASRWGGRMGAGAALLILSLVVGIGGGSSRSYGAAVQATPIAIASATCTPPTAAAPTSPPARTPTVGVPADVVVAAQITSAIAKLVACWNDGDWTTSIALASDHYLLTTAGTADRATVTASHVAQSRAGLGPQSSLDAVTDVRGHGDAFASADVVWRQGKAAKHQRWYFLTVNGDWLLDEIQELGPDVSGDAVGIEATIDAAGLSLSRDRIVSPGVVVIHVRNPGSDLNTLSVFRSAEPDDLRSRLSNAPAGGESAFIGEVVLPPTTEGDLVLVDVAADAYTLVVGFRGADGTLQVQDALTAMLAIATT